MIWGGIHGGMLALERMAANAGWRVQLPGVVKTAFTFAVVLVTWVFFRARDLPAAAAYCRTLAGLGDPQPAADLVAGLVYRPYFVLSMAAAAIVVWACPQTWDFTRRMSWPKAAFCVGVLLLSLATMETQAFNPFIYFIF